MNKRYWVLFVMALFSIITYLDRTSISITGSAITQELNLSEKEFEFSKRKGNLLITGSTSTANWTIKGIVRSI